MKKMKMLSIFNFNKTCRNEVRNSNNKVYPGRQSQDNLGQEMNDMSKDKKEDDFEEEVNKIEIQNTNKF